MIKFTKDDVKLRWPLANKLDDGYTWGFFNKKPEWHRHYYNWSKENELSCLNQLFGQNGASFYAQLGMKGHNGTDWYCPEGCTVLAVTDGIIGWVNNPKSQASYQDGYGGYVEIKFESKGKYYKYNYGHLSDVFVKTGDRVHMGQVLGLTGNTGKYTTGAHLHTGLALVDQNGNKLEQNNGYLGYRDELECYIDAPKFRELKDIEKLFYYAVGNGDVGYYYGLLGGWRFDNAKSKLSINSYVTRSNYYDYTIAHK